MESIAEYQILILSKLALDHKLSGLYTLPICNEYSQCYPTIEKNWLELATENEQISDTSKQTEMGRDNMQNETQFPQFHLNLYISFITLFSQSRHKSELGLFYKSCRAAPNHRNLSSTEVRLGATLLFYKNKTFAVLCCAEP